MKGDLGLVHIYWGDGKGKTTAAIGLALRALAPGYNVHIVQFMKKTSKGFAYENEISMLKKFNNFSFRGFGTGKWVREQDIDKDAISEGHEYLKSVLADSPYDLVIADEILYAVQFSLISEQEIVDLIKLKSKNKEFVLTGSHIPHPNIFRNADIITEIKKHRHPFDSGLLARKGIEY